jgi:AcrR family transcriptional regulator
MNRSDQEPFRPLRADAARNRERILAAAQEVFAQRGLDATLDEVAQNAGLGVGTVYRRFPTKDDLVEALFEQTINRVVELAEEAADMTDSWQGVVSFLERATEMLAENLGLRDIILHGGHGRDRVTLARAKIIPAVTHLVERAQEDGFLRRDFLPTDIPVIELMVSSVALYTSSMAPDLWRRYLGIVLDGLRAERKGTQELVPGPSYEVIEVALHTQKLRKI